MKDLFSESSDNYKKYRPVYPAKMYEMIYSRVSSFNNAADLATGNGQIAFELSEKFKNVFAIDLSENQLDQVLQKENILYSKQSVESTNLPSNFFNLITCGQAMHWLDGTKFNKEIKRIAANYCIFACLYYHLPQIKNSSNIIQKIYDELEEYWHPERRIVENNYKNFPLDINEREDLKFDQTQLWTKERLFGYIKTWSAFRNHQKINIKEIIDNKMIEKFDDEVEVNIPYFLIVGKIN